MFVRRVHTDALVVFLRNTRSNFITNKRVPDKKTRTTWPNKRQRLILTERPTVRLRISLVLSVHARRAIEFVNVDHRSVWMLPTAMSIILYYHTSCASRARTNRPSTVTSALSENKNNHTVVQRSVDNAKRDSSVL